MDDLSLRNAMDSCRPSSDDLAQPELSQLAEHLQDDPELARQFERMQQWDATVGQAIRECQKINRITGFDEVRHRSKNLAMRRVVKVGRLQEGDDVVHFFGLDENRAEDRLFGFVAVGWGQVWH